jgi:hypothetical protein
MKDSLNAAKDESSYIGKAFITLRKQSKAEKLVDTFKMHLLIRAFFFVYYTILRCKKSKLEKRFWEGQRIIVERAAEPADVYWENLSVKEYERILRTLLTYSVTILLLIVVFGIYFALNILKKFLEDNSNNSGSDIDFWLLMIVTFLTSIFVVVVNTILFVIIRVLSAYEKHVTYTKYHLSVAFKLTIATLINVALLPIFTRLEQDQWFKSGGLATTIFYNTISVSFVSPLLQLFSFPYIIKKFKMWREERKGEMSKLNQRQANELFEGPQIKIASVYSNTGLLILIVCIYTPMIPLLPIIGLIGIFFQYWVEKYLLLRRYSIPETIGNQMAVFYAAILPYALLLYSISNYYFLWDLSDGKNKHGQAAMWFMLAYILLPVRIILNLFTDNISRDDSADYFDTKFTFIQDYDRNNPMTSNEAKHE